MPAKKTTTTTKAATAATEVSEAIIQEATSQPVVPATAPVAPAVYRVKETMTPDTFVTVRNGFSGKLVYRSRKTGERFIWERFGDEQDIELQELKNAKSASRLFFENNWFMFDDPAVIEYLGVERYYKNAIPLDAFDDVFEMKPDQLAKKISALSSGQRNSLAYRARQKIGAKEIDSLKVIDTLEECLGIELIER